MKILVQLFWNNICSQLLLVSAVLNFTDYLYNMQLHTHLSLHLTGALKRDDFEMYDETHMYAFLPKLKSACQISFQVIHVGVEM